VTKADIGRSSEDRWTRSNPPICNFDLDIRKYLTGGIAAHAAARVMAQSGWDEVLMSRVVTDLVAGAQQNSSPRNAGSALPFERENCLNLSQRCWV
jgi:hypothetical protein